MNENRFNQIDIAKGIGIILVVIGHTATHLGIEKIIYQFHMPLFFILSGFFFKDKYLDKPLSFLFSRLKRLYIPYVLNGLRLFFVFVCISYLVKERTGFSFLGGLKYCLLIISGLGSAPFAGAMWFLRALFIVSFIFIFLKWIISKIVGDKKKKIILFLSVVGFLIIGYKTQLPYNISSSFVALFFYYIGYLYSKNKNQVIMNIYIVLLALAILLYATFTNSVDLAYNTYTSIWLFILSSVSGTYIIVYVSEKIKQNYILEYMGQKSLSIMLFHFLSFVTINVVVVVFYDLPIEKVLAYPTIIDYNWWWILYSVMGVLGSLFINKWLTVFEKKLPHYFTFTYWLDKLTLKFIK
jgi:fucose 4-O-acetylase-like acetyltransferase